MMHNTSRIGLQNPCLVCYINFRGTVGIFAILPKYMKSKHQMSSNVIKWKHFPCCWPSVPVNSSHKGQLRGALMFSLICTRINGWVNNREAGDLRPQSRPLWLHCNGIWIAGKRRLPLTHGLLMTFIQYKNRQPRLVIYTVLFHVLNTPPCAQFT